MRSRGRRQNGGDVIDVDHAVASYRVHIPVQLAASAGGSGGTCIGKLIGPHVHNWRHVVAQESFPAGEIPRDLFIRIAITVKIRDV